jgi:hypothetical protein
MLASRIRFVTRNFYQVQGLRMVPWALLILLFGLGRFGWLDWLPGYPPQRPLDLGVLWGILAVLVATGAFVSVSQYYRTHFGTVRLQHGDNLFILPVLVTVTVDAVHRPTNGAVIPAALLLAAALLGLVMRDGRLRAHYAPAALAWFGLGMVPLAGVQDATVGAAAYLTGASTLLICGVGDHLVMVGTFPRSPSSHSPVSISTVDAAGPPTF